MAVRPGFWTNRECEPQGVLLPDIASSAKSIFAPCLRPINCRRRSLPEPCRTRGSAVFCHRCANRTKSAIKKAFDRAQVESRDLGNLRYWHLFHKTKHEYGSLLPR